MVALLGFFDLVEVLGEILFAEERRAVDALQPRFLSPAWQIGHRRGFPHHHPHHYKYELWQCPILNYREQGLD